ncbi:MAG: hypothetical protein A3E25_00425 [Burkholderiales bacterium RIFCSPHIGHO2_12_FULL_69_20]|nr:MAG: hypothetical protein A3E25_00425 [Burkholderiales bacterium RIFCSPHIGHO2_12_FULL_69_20]
MVQQPARAQGGGDDWPYVVVRGDTLIGVTARYLAPPHGWRDLQRHNHVKRPRRLMPGSTLRIPEAWLGRTATVAEVMFLQGDATVRSNAQAAWAPLGVGSTLAAGSQLRTGADASLTLRFADGSRLLVVPGTELAIEQLFNLGPRAQPHIRLRLDRGNVDAQVQPLPARPPRFEIRTPALNLGVRGTEFRARVEAVGGASRAEVLSGLVAAAGGRVEQALATGFGLLARPGEPPGAPRRLMAAPQLQGLPARVERLPLALAWTPLDGATAYRAQVFAADDQGLRLDPLHLDGRFDAAQAKWADLPDGRYLLRVRAVDALGLEGADALQAFTVKARPEPPFTRQPAAGAQVVGEQARLVWAASTAAMRYRLQVGGSPDFVAPLLDRADLRAPEFTLALPPGAYHWRVASIVGDSDQGPFGDAQSFTQRGLPTSPVMSPPQVHEGGLLFRWPAPAAGQRVQFQFAADAGFEQVLLDQVTTAAEVTVPTPAPGHYHLRARTIDADGVVGPFGATQQVQVPEPPRSWWPLLLPLGAVLLLL